MSLLHASPHRFVWLRRLRRNAWAAIGLCILFRIASALAEPLPPVPGDFQLVSAEFYS